MCGGTDLVKQEGVFACQSCGTKYSVEEAKKMIIEGIVEVAGTVKIDVEDEVLTMLKLARTAAKGHDFSTAERLYSAILSKMATNWEADIVRKITSIKNSLSQKNLGEAYTPAIQIKDAIKTSIKNLPYDVAVEGIKQTIEIIHFSLSALISDTRNLLLLPFHDGSMCALDKQGTFVLGYIEAMMELSNGILNKFYKNNDLVKLAFKIQDDCIRELSMYNSKSKLNDMHIERMNSLRKQTSERINFEYWKQCPEEKEKLDSEKMTLSQRINAIDSETESLDNALPEKAAYLKAAKECENLVKQKDSITGLFKGKEKKAAQDKVDEAMTNERQAKKSYELALENKVGKLNSEKDNCEKRIKNITEELTKERC